MPFKVKQIFKFQCVQIIFVIVINTLKIILTQY